jgi:hypothetical protein
LDGTTTMSINQMCRRNKHFGLFAFLLLCCEFIGAQAYDLREFSTRDLADLKSPSPNWQIVGEVSGGYSTPTVSIKPGTGILLNNYNKDYQYKTSADLISNFEHGDIYLELDFLLPKGSNSGIYLQGRYEIQLYDTWATVTPKQGDCGGIYQRWVEAEKRGYEGHAPRINACLAPGTWQHMEIKFSAPKFDASGKKIRHAVMEKVILNGVTIHENVTLLGVTRGAMSENEVASGPLRIQGDHGQVAFRNIKYALLNDIKVSASDIQYEYYEGQFEQFSEAKPEKLTRKGVTPIIDFQLADNPNKAILIFSGKVNLPETAEYLWSTQQYGLAKLEVDGNEVVKTNWQHDLRPNTGKVNLTAGEHQFKLYYLKNFNWRPSALGLNVQKANAKPVALHALRSLPDPEPTPLIALNPNKEPELLRCYYEFTDRKRTHVIAVGDPGGVHYAYDLNQGAILDLWKGPFANATEMWYERGEPQIAMPMGAKVRSSGVGAFAANNVIADSLDTENTLLFKQYRLDSKGYPTFTYLLKGKSVSDAIRPMEDRKGLKRSLVLGAALSDGLVCRLAQGKSIEALGENLYAVDQKYYVQLPAGYVANIQSGNGMKVLVLQSSPSPLQIDYFIIF